MHNSKGFWPINKIRAVLRNKLRGAFSEQLFVRFDKIETEEDKMFSNVVQTKAMKTCIKKVEHGI